ncbi:MAG: hypothetical protein JNL29_13125 [Nitrospira sp.]|nr:hypothetical protein [Nitrospira sp.]
MERPTHARYTGNVGSSCSPANVKQSAFPVAQEGARPAVDGCTNQNYALLIMIGVGVAD